VGSLWWLSEGGVGAGYQDDKAWVAFETKAKQMSTIRLDDVPFPQVPAPPCCASPCSRIPTNRQNFLERHPRLTKHLGCRRLAA